MAPLMVGPGGLRLITRVRLYRVESGRVSWMRSHSAGRYVIPEFPNGTQGWRNIISEFAKPDLPGRRVVFLWSGASELSEQEFIPWKPDLGTSSIPEPIERHRQQTRAVEIQGKIRLLLDSAGKENWDGDGARPVAASTVDVATQLASLLPYTEEVPEVSATAHGEVYLEWVENGILAVAVCPPPDHEIVFSGRLDDESFKGTMPWSGTVPRLLVCGLGAIA